MQRYFELETLAAQWRIAHQVLENAERFYDEYQEQFYRAVAYEGGRIAALYLEQQAPSRGNYQKCIKDIEQRIANASREERQPLEFVHGLISLLQSKGRKRNTLIEFKTVIKRCGALERAWTEGITLLNCAMNIADASKKHRILKRSSDAWTHFLEYSPNFAEAHVCRGIAYAYQEKHQDAEKDFEEAMKLKPALATQHLLLRNEKMRPRAYSGETDDLCC